VDAGLLDGAGYARVAESTGIPIGSIGPTRQRALAQLRAALTARGLHR
jgi:DNA-directed RNA polymerase specialized sigma24 family protein